MIIRKFYLTRHTDFENIRHLHDRETYFQVIHREDIKERSLRQINTTMC
jgi:hypothetical protein